jgi:predicted AlkP superfamily phosphohydrolase/phosphomutase
MKMKKVLLIILDGARLDVVNKWIREGALPNLQSLIDNGVSGNLKSVFPIHTMLAFAALMTGKNPGKNGIYDMQLQKPGTYRLIIPNSTNIKGKTIFEIASEGGNTILSINIPLTEPPQKLNGVIVCSWLTPPFANYTYPEDVSKTLNQMGYKIQPSILDRDSPGFERELYDTTEKRFEAVRWLMQSNDWSLAAVLITGTEHMHHNYAAFLDSRHPDHSPEQEVVVKKYYSFVDGKIGELLKIIDSDTTVFVISDHGFGPSYGEIYMNNVLEKYDYFKSKVEFSPTRKVFGFLESSGIANKLRNTARIDLFKHMPESVKKFISEGRAGGISADWGSTIAYCTGVLGGIRINLKGREPQGIVSKDSYERARDEIIEALEKDEDIGIYVSKVWKREELYQGPYVNEAPDLYVELKKCYTTSPETPRNMIFGKWKKVGFHTLQGMLIARGKDVVSGKRVDADIVDIAPTILHMLGLPIPDDADGKVLKEMFIRTSNPAMREVKTQKVEVKREEVERSAEEEEIVKKRLKDLGYI